MASWAPLLTAHTLRREAWPLAGSSSSLPLPIKYEARSRLRGAAWCPHSLCVAGRDVVGMCSRLQAGRTMGQRGSELHPPGPRGHAALTQVEGSPTPRPPWVWWGLPVRVPPPAQRARSSAWEQGAPRPAGWPRTHTHTEAQGTASMTQAVWGELGPLFSQPRADLWGPWRETEPPARSPPGLSVRPAVGRGGRHGASGLRRAILGLAVVFCGSVRSCPKPSAPNVHSGTFAGSEGQKSRKGTAGVGGFCPRHDVWGDIKTR